MCVYIFRPISERRDKIDEIEKIFETTTAQIFSELTQNKWFCWKSELFPELYRDKDEFSYKAKIRFKTIWSKNFSKIVQDTKDELIS